MVPVWHCEQSPVLGCAASAMLKVLAVAFGRLWKPVYCAPAVMVVGAMGYAAIPIQTKLVSWQAEQPPVMPVWICVVVGAGVANAVPGAVLLAEAGTMPLGVVPK